MLIFFFYDFNVNVLNTIQMLIYVNDKKTPWINLLKFQSACNLAKKAVGYML